MHSSPASQFAAALELIAHGTGDEKVRYIAERDADWFVDHVLSVDYVDRDEVTPAQGRMSRPLLDQAIARIALKAHAYDAIDEMRAAG